MIENVPEIPCLYDRHKTCTEFLCPLQPFNERNIKDMYWKIRKKEFTGFRRTLQKENIDITEEMICNLLLNPNQPTRSNGSALYGARFTSEHKKFGDLIAGYRKAWIDKYDNHWDAFYVKCLNKKQDLYSHTK